MSWWYAVNNEKLGPVDQAALLALYREQKIAAGTLVWTKGMADWQTFGSIEALQAQLADVPEAEIVAQPAVVAEQPAVAPEQSAVAPEQPPISPEQPPVATKPAPIMTGEPARRVAPQESSSKKVLLYVFLVCVLVLVVAYAFMTGIIPANPLAGSTQSAAPSPAPTAQKAPANSVAWKNPSTKLQADIDRAWIFKDESDATNAEYSFVDKEDTVSLFIRSEPTEGRTLEKFIQEFKDNVTKDNSAVKFKDGGKTMAMPQGMPSGSRAWQVQAVVDNGTKGKSEADINLLQTGKLFWVVVSLRTKSANAEKKVMLDILRLRVIKTLK